MMAGRWATRVVAAAGVGVLAIGLGPGARAQEPTTTTATTAGLGGEVTVAEVADAVSEDGWYAHPGAVGDREQLNLLAERLALQGNPMGFALLDSEPTGGSTGFAEEVLDALLLGGDRRIRTVLVLSDADVGLVSDVWGDQSIDDALDATIDELRADPIDGLEALADALAAEPTLDEEDISSADGGDDGGPSSAWLGAGVIVLVLGLAASRFLPGAERTYDGDDTRGSSWSRRRRRSFSGSSFRSRSSSRRSSSGSSRRSSSGSRRGRGGRRL